MKAPNAVRAVPILLVATLALLPSDLWAKPRPKRMVAVAAAEPSRIPADADPESAAAADSTLVVETAPGRREDVIAVVPPDGRLAGRVLRKDGVTPVSYAEIVLSGVVTDSTHFGVTDEDGAFSMTLPLGRYSLEIHRHLDIYASPTTYTVPGDDEIRLDFLLLPHYEGEPGDVGGGTARNGAANGAPHNGTHEAIDARRRLPDPPRMNPEVVGSVVDMVPPAEAKQRRRWGEWLGLLGSLVVVGLASD